MKKNTFYIYGRQPIKELLERQPRLIKRIYIRETGTSDFFHQVIAVAKAQKVPIQKIPEKKIIELVGDVNDQGIVADIKEFAYHDFHEWLNGLSSKKRHAVLLLDEIEDPHNVGAIIRSAAAFGISAVLLPSHRQAGVTATVFKTSAGAVTALPIIQIGNVNQTIEILKKNDFWIAGLAGDKGSTPLHDQVFDTSMVFIIGNEGKGIREKTKELCDFLISIPISPAVESLNASVASAVVAYEWRNAQKKNK